MIVIVMGVSGSGKSTIARTLARKCRLEFVDADSFHSEENIAKMRAGVPLTDEDRLPWLNSLRGQIREWIAGGKSAVLACSALKRQYRDILNVDSEHVRFAYLKGSFPLFHSRLERRKKHFMGSDLLKSQFAALEEPGPDEAIICDARKTVKAIVEKIMSETE